MRGAGDRLEPVLAPLRNPARAEIGSRMSHRVQPILEMRKDGSVVGEKKDLGEARLSPFTPRARSARGRKPRTAEVSHGHHFTKTARRFPCCLSCRWASSTSRGHLYLPTRAAARRRVPSAAAAARRAACFHTCCPQCSVHAREGAGQAWSPREWSAGCKRSQP